MKNFAILLTFSILMFSCGTTKDTGTVTEIIELNEKITELETVIASLEDDKVQLQEDHIANTQALRNLVDELSKTNSGLLNDYYRINKNELDEKYKEARIMHDQSTIKWTRCYNDNGKDETNCWELKKWIYLWKARMDVLLDITDNKLRHPTKL